MVKDSFLVHEEWPRFGGAFFAHAALQQMLEAYS